jgi:hypothetical protein
MHNTPIRSWSAFLRKGALSRRRFWRAAAGTVVLLAGTGLFLPIPARAQEAKHIHTTNGNVDFATMTTALPGYSVLIWTENDIAMRLHATDLIAGHAYTFWVVVFDPDGSQYAGRVDGQVVNLSGIVNLKVEVEVGEIVGDFHLPALGFPEGKLRNPMTSTIALVIRDHGPASSDPAKLNLQLYTHETDDPVPTDYAISIHAPPPP